MESRSSILFFNHKPFSEIFTKCQNNPGLDVIEIQTDRNRNVDLHQILVEYVNQQLSNNFTDLG